MTKDKYQNTARLLEDLNIFRNKFPEFKATCYKVSGYFVQEQAVIMLKGKIKEIDVELYMPPDYPNSYPIAHLPNRYYLGIATHMYLDGDSIVKMVWKSYWTIMTRFYDVTQKIGVILDYGNYPAVPYRESAVEEQNVLYQPKPAAEPRLLEPVLPQFYGGGNLGPIYLSYHEYPQRHAVTPDPKVETPSWADFMTRKSESYEALVKERSVVSEPIHTNNEISHILNAIERKLHYLSANYSARIYQTKESRARIEQSAASIYAFYPIKGKQMLCVTTYATVQDIVDYYKCYFALGFASCQSKAVFAASDYLIKRLANSSLDVDDLNYYLTIDDLSVRIAYLGY